MNNEIDFEKKLNEILTVFGDKKRHLAQKTGFIETTVSHYFKGKDGHKPAKPSVDFVKALLRAYPINADWLFFDKGEMLKNQESKLDLDKVNNQLAKIMADLNEVNEYLKKYSE